MVTVTNQPHTFRDMWYIEQVEVSNGGREEEGGMERKC